MQRRKFIKNTSLGFASLSAPFHQIKISSHEPSSMFVGTPVLPEYLYEKGIPETLDAMQELAGINTVMTFSHDHVFRECRRAVKAVNGAAKVYARPGFDMPGYDCNVTPEQVYRATTRALEAGVDGLWCGREWDELKTYNAQAFGNAVKDWQRKK